MNDTTQAIVLLEDLLRREPAAPVKDGALREVLCSCGARHLIPAALADRAIFCPSCRGSFRPETAVPSAAPHARALARRLLAIASWMTAAAATAATAGRRALARTRAVHVNHAIERLGYLRRRLVRRLRAVPCWTLSAAVHAALVFLCVGLLASAPDERIENAAFMAARMAEPERFEPAEDAPRDLFRMPAVIEREVATEVPLITQELDLHADLLDINELDRPLRAPDLAFADVPLGGADSTGAFLGPGPGGATGLGSGAGVPGAFGLREGLGKQKALRRYGGGPETESAVRRALAWLARNQNADGSWEMNGPGSGARVLTDRSGDRYRAAVTGFAVLAFLGAGHTPAGRTEHAPVVRKGIDWLVRSQRDDGAFAPTPLRGRSGRSSGRSSVCMYTQGIVTLALAEAYGMTRERRLGAVAQKAVDFTVQSARPYGGWDYAPSGGRPGGIDHSITIWCCLALKSARIAGLKVDGRAWEGIRNWLDGCQLTGEPGAVPAVPASVLRWLRSRHSGKELDRQIELYRERLRAQAGVRGAFAYRGSVGKGGAIRARRGTCGGVMTAAGLLMRLYTGERRESPLCTDPAKILIDHFSGGPKMPLTPGERINSVSAYGEDLYFFYHATVPMFQMGGERWRKWNAIMKTHVLPCQTRGGPDDGAWPAERCYRSKTMATALGAMTLEIYYRYLPLYR